MQAHRRVIDLIHERFNDGILETIGVMAPYSARRNNKAE
jgi:hypothetical protein